MENGLLSWRSSIGIFNAFGFIRNLFLLRKFLLLRSFSTGYDTLFFALITFNLLTVYLCIERKPGPINDLPKKPDLDKTLVGAAAPQSTGTAFSCSPRRSWTSPTSVHRLRPEDIDVVGAIGDSVSVGLGVFAKTLIGVFLSYRGHSFTAGGADSLSKHTTLPNILKKFNSRLTGYSTGIGGPDDDNAKFNLAVNGARASAMPDQARKLVQRMKSSLGSRSFAQKWKLINVLIGGNDVCRYCKSPSTSTPAELVRHVREALDYLQKESPRTLVNLLLTVDASAVADIQEASPICKALFKSFLCQCPVTRPRSEVNDYVRQVHQLTLDLYKSGRYDSGDSFTVALQPFMRYTKPALDRRGKVDLSYFAPDCFHLNAKGHAAAARALWENMLQPEGSKTQQVDWSRPPSIVCPTKSRPYIFTRKNS